jgi:hypothetical protein
MSNRPAGKGKQAGKSSKVRRLANTGKGRQARKRRQVGRKRQAGNGR